VRIQESDDSTEVNEDGLEDNYSVVLTAKPTTIVAVAISPDGELDVSPKSLTFGPDNWDAPQTVNVTAVNDDAREGIHFGTISHSVSSEDPEYDGLATSDIMVAIGDNDTSVSIVDNGHAGFSKRGRWRWFPNQGYERNVDFSRAGTGSDVASWRFAVTPGEYMVAATWSAHPNRATDAPYTVLDGSTVLDTIEVNQELVPTDFTEQSVKWETLGIFNITSGTLHVELSDKADEFVIADAIRVERVGDTVPGVRIMESAGSTEVREDGRKDSYEIVLTSQPNGDVQISVTPDDQTEASSTGLTFTADNWTVPQTVQVTAINDDVSEGPHEATILHSVSSEDAQYDGMTIPEVRVVIVDDDTVVSIVDNGDVGFGQRGLWWWFPDQGYDREVYFSGPGSGLDMASWSLAVSPGRYAVAATWSEHPNRATNAGYTVLDGSTVLERIEVNQELAPNSFTDLGVAWKTLGVFTITTNLLEVQLSDDADEYLIADAVRIEQVNMDELRQT
jgi:hypothetical protein